MPEAAHHDSQALLDELGRAPNDLSLRDRAARALQLEGREPEAIALLTSTLKNLTAHAPPPLPCMCKRCLDPTRSRAESGGLSFQRDFALAEGRVLFFWVPDELRRRQKGIRHSVRTALQDKLKKRKRS